MFKSLLLSLLLKHALKKHELKQELPIKKGTDAYIVYVTVNNTEYLAKAVARNSKLYVYNKDDNDEEWQDAGHWVYLADIEQMEIHHFYGVERYCYKNKKDFIRHIVTRRASRDALLKSQVMCWLASRHKVKLPTRLDVLTAMNEDIPDAPVQRVTPSEVFKKIYGYKWYLQTHEKALTYKVEQIFQSFCDSGEMDKVPDSSIYYTVNGKALVTLEHLSEEKARNDRAESYSKWMTILTLILVITGLFQAGLIKTTYFSDIDWLMELLHDYIELSKEWIRTVE